MLEIKDLTIETDSRKTIIEKLNVFLDEGDKLAVIGEEGNGKSTLLKVIHKPESIEDYCRISGEINRTGLTIAYLEQSLDEDWYDKEVYEYFVKDSPDDDINYDLFSNMHSFSAELSKIGINPTILESGQLIGTLSGGEKVKIQIAKLLVKNPDIWLLDEPTNDLDIETLEWLETFMLSQEKPILFVSHDETLLENVANRILHLEYLKNSRRARHTLANLNYGTYVRERSESLEKQSQAYSREKRENLKDKQILSRQKSAVRTAQIKVKDSAVRRILNKKMKNILVQERYAEEKRKTEKVETEDPIYMQFDERVQIPDGKVVLDLDLEKLELYERVLSRDIKLFIRGPEKIGIVGRNGVGKTTLLRYIYEDLKEREDLKVGYMPQDYNEVFPGNEKVLDYLTSGLEDIEEDLIRAYIGRIKLTWEEMNDVISSLSLGQKAKVILLKIMLRGDNVLILDEPTRNMSALSNPVIRKVLKNFEGAIISVSHDRKYLEEVCDKRYNLTPEGLEGYELT